MSGYVPLPAPVTADPGFWQKGVEGLNALRDQQAKQASADAYRQATDPATGQVDQARYNALISQGPGAWNAGPLMEQQGRAQGAQAQGSAEQVSGRLAQLKVMSNEMSDLLQSGQPITADQIHARLNSLGKEGILTQTAMNGINADLNSQPPGADLTQWLRNHYATGLSASEALKNVTSQPQTVDQGDRKIVVEGNPNMPGGQRVGSVYTQGQAPPALGTTVTIHYPDGHDEQVTPDQVRERLGGNPGSFVISPGGGSAGSGGGAATNNPLNMRFAGQEGATNAGGFAAFKTPEAGQAATDALFSQYADRGINTLSGLISRWAPPSENDTPGYIARVAKATGLDPNAPINLKDPVVARKIQQAMAAVEGNKNASVASASVPAAPTTPPAAPGGAPQSTATVGRPGGPGTYLGPGFGVLPPAGAPASTSPTLRSGIPGGVQVASADPSFAPTVGEPTATSPLVSGDGNAIMAGRNLAARPLGTQMAFNALQSGGPAIAAAPAVPGAAPQSGVQPPAPAPMRAGVTPSLGAGERVKADIDAYTKDAGAVGIHQNNINTLQNAYRALQLADTGPGTQNLQAARAFLQSFGITTSATGDQATQWAEAHKYLMDYARTQGGLGGTDLQLLASKESNASTDIPKPAALAVVRNNIARERMAMAQVQEAPGSAGYVDHTKTFLPSQDLRAYQADIMPPQELKQIEALQKTNPKAFEKFQKSLDIARAHGLISDEDLAAQNQRIRALGP